MGLKMYKGLCGKSCDICSYHKNFGCACRNYSCLLFRCLVKKEKIFGITYPAEQCLYKRLGVCPRYSNSLESISLPPDKVPDKHLSLNQTSSVSKIFEEIGRQRYVPVIDLLNQDTWIWDVMDNLKCICVRLQQILSNRDVWSISSAKSLRDILNFNGYILLSTIMPDELIDQLDVKIIVNLIRRLDPDIVMSMDYYTYFDDPLHISWFQVLTGIQYITGMSNIQKPLLPIIKGASPIQVKTILNFLKRSNCEYVIFPVREFVRDNRLLLNQIVTVIRKVWQGKYMIYGGPLNFVYLYKDAFAYIGYEWYLKSKQLRFFNSGNFLYLDSDAQCILWIKDNDIRCVRDLMVYNLTNIISFLGGKI